MQTYLVAGNITGLNAGGAPITLVNNGKDTLTVNANGGFQFPTALASGATYSITVATQPTGETCTVSNGSGTVSSANVTSISVSCSAIPAKTYTVGGNVAGLNAGSSVTLKNNGSDTVSVSANGSFVFPVSLVNAAAYNVTVGTQPTGETCTTSNAIGTVNNANVANVSVVCTANAPITYTIGGTVSGLGTGASVTLLDNGADATTLSSNGAFTFPTALQGGASWAVTVGTQPTGETCSVSNANGTKIGANITTVTVTCTPNPTYSIGGTVSGLRPGTSVALENSGSNPLTVAANGTFVFGTQLASGAAYNVTVTTQPAAGNCTVTNGSGTVSAANVTSVSVTCVAAQFVYATDTDGNIYEFAVNAATGALTPLPGSPLAVGGSLAGIALNPAGTVAYVAQFANNKLAAFSINVVTGALTPLGAPVATGNSPLGVTIAPSGKFAYVTNVLGNSVSAYSIDATTGALTPVAGSPFTAGIRPYAVAIDPTGRFAYVPNYYTGSTSGPGSVSAYTIDAVTGALTPVPGSPFLTAGGHSESITISPAGTVVYTGDFQSISAWSIDQTTGALTSIGTFESGTYISDVAINPAGTVMYASSGQAANIYTFAIDSISGVLTPITGGPFQTAAVANAIAIPPSGALLYGATSLGVVGETIDASTGAVATVPGSPFATGSVAAGTVTQSVVITP
ncbi:lactonase family protein [Paraburkholderia acidicola]|uniref:Lactonase family protein n=1 Tax=Paraburkholderia acidicola TaxID=1912599 RepID=A0ABV1LXY6_9BURK